MNFPHRTLEFIASTIEAFAHALIDELKPGLSFDEKTVIIAKVWGECKKEITEVSDADKEIYGKD
jgi:hypothetical protein